MEINAIANNMEKYIAFMLGKHLIFLDSFQFMSSSLDKLACNLPGDALKYTTEAFKNDQFKLMKKKQFILMIIWTHLKSSTTQKYQKRSFLQHSK